MMCNDNDSTNKRASVTAVGGLGVSHVVPGKRLKWVAGRLIDGEQGVIYISECVRECLERRRRPLTLWPLIRRANAGILEGRRKKSDEMSRMHWHWHRDLFFSFRGSCAAQLPSFTSPWAHSITPYTPPLPIPVSGLYSFLLVLINTILIAC